MSKLVGTNLCIIEMCVVNRVSCSSLEYNFFYIGSVFFRDDTCGVNLK